jgi:2-isopropylmalate synthase
VRRGGQQSLRDIAKPKNTTHDHRHITMTTEAHSNNRVIIFDTTLRDGEQSPGAAMTLEQKIDVAIMLEALGVDVIEAGFPISSNGDFEAVQKIAAAVRKPIICGLARAGFKDIDRAAEALKGAARARIHTFISTSPVHMKHKLQMEPHQVLEAAIASVARARNHVDDVEWSAEDATRTEFDFLCRCVEGAIRAGATTINIPDTVGYSAPDEYAALIRTLIARVPGAERVRFSTHCHNDLGLAAANSLAGVAGGARQVECTINGIGERAGNAALEEIVMALKVRGDIMPFHTGIDTAQLSRASKLVASVTGFPVQFNKAIVGKNAFAHESGIHQDGMLKNTQTYEIMTPESVGVAKTSLVLGKLSGRHAFKDKLKALGYEFADNQLEDAFRRFKDLADKKKHVFDEDIVALVDDQIAHDHDRIKVLHLRVFAGTYGPPLADVELNADGRVLADSARGDGAIDAIFSAIRKIIPHTAVLRVYDVHAVTEGTDAQANVTVQLEDAGLTVTGRGTHEDTLMASAKAYVHALNKLQAKRARTAQEAVNAAAS